MLWAQIAVTLLSLPICCFAPGFLIVKGLRWRPLEKVCGAVAASLLILYLLTWAVFCLAPGAETGIYRAVGCAALALAAWQWREFRKLALAFSARQALTGFAFLLLWSVPALAMIRVYSGAGWGGDWLEHFQRTLFFLHHLPADIQIAGGYIVPARPPMMNLLGAFFLGQIADRYEIFQIVSAFLNLLAFLPCCLMLRAVLKSRRARYLPLVALFALNPMMMQNAWYPWTKLLAVFYILFAIWLYLAGLRKSDGVRIVAAFVCLACGLIVHYSAGPYVVFLGGHYLLRVFLKRPHRMRELAAIVICSALVLAPWFGWSMKTYGVHGTVGSNTSVTAAQSYKGSAAARIAGNIFNTIVPAILHDPESLSMFNQPNKWAELRDNAFVFYQTNLIFAMGLIGGPVALWLLYRAFRRTRAGPERNFWLAFLPTIVLLGIVVVGEADLMGLAHLTLIPVVALGVTLIAANFPWGRPLAALLLMGCALDFSLGIFLQEKVESLHNSPQHTYFNGLSLEDNRLTMGAQGPETIGGAAWLNWFWKSRAVIDRQWLEQLSHLPQSPGVTGFESRLRDETRANQRNFGGWYEQHGGAITFLGDWTSGPSLAGAGVPAGLALALFVGLMAWFGKEAMRFAPVAVVQTAPALRKRAAAKRR